jgi:hypothetical protein
MFGVHSTSGKHGIWDSERPFYQGNDVLPALYRAFVLDQAEGPWLEHQVSGANGDKEDALGQQVVDLLLVKGRDLEEYSDPLLGAPGADVQLVEGWLGDLVVQVPDQDKEPQVVRQEPVIALFHAFHAVLAIEHWGQQEEAVLVLELAIPLARVHVAAFVVVPVSAH